MSTASSPSLRKRGGKKEDDSSPSLAGQGGSPVAPKPQSEWKYRLAAAILTVLAFITRFYKISYPAEVIFDEVHFGKVCSDSSNGCAGEKLTTVVFICSLPHTISNAPISSMFTLRSVNSSSL